MQSPGAPLGSILSTGDERTFLDVRISQRSLAQLALLGMKLGSHCPDLAALSTQWIPKVATSILNQSSIDAEEKSMAVVLQSSGGTVLLHWQPPNGKDRPGPTYTEVLGSHTVLRLIGGIVKPE